MTHHSRMENGTVVRGYPAPYDGAPSEVPGHDARFPSSYDNRFQPDIRQLSREQKSLAQHQRQHGKFRFDGVTTQPCGLRTVPTLVTTGPIARVLVLALPQNSRRKRFIIPNSDVSAFNIYFSFGNNPNILIPVVVGAVWDESGSGIVTEEIWIATSTPNATIGLYEAVLDEQVQKS